MGHTDVHGGPDTVSADPDSGGRLIQCVTVGHADVHGGPDTVSAGPGSGGGPSSV